MTIFQSNYRGSHIPSSWTVLGGCVLLSAFTRIGHECQDLLSPGDGMHRLDLGWYSHPKKFFVCLLLFFFWGRGGGGGGGGVASRHPKVDIFPCTNVSPQYLSSNKGYGNTTDFFFKKNFICTAMQCLWQTQKMCVVCGVCVCVCVWCVCVCVCVCVVWVGGRGGNGVRTHVNSKGKIPSTRGSEKDWTRAAASRRTANPAHYQLHYSGP